MRVKVVDQSGMPLEGVNRIPQHLYGRGNRLSDKNGFIYVPNSGYFYMHKPGYKTLWVDVGVDGSLATNEVYIMEIETRSDEEAIADNAAKSDALREKYRQSIENGSAPSTSTE